MAPSRAVAGALAAVLTGSLTAALARAQAVTHFDVPALEREVTYDLGDLRGVPNALFDSAPGFPNGAAFAIRGGASQPYETSFDPAVGVYQDGIYLGRTAVPFLELYDLDSVEVARGPQGVLSGRASPAGAIELRSRPPSGKFGTRGQASFGDRGMRDYRLAVDVPLLPERLAGTVALFQRQSSGHFPNSAPPGDGGRLGDVERWGMRGALRFTPVDAFELTVRADMLKDRSGGAPIDPVPDGSLFHVAQEMQERNHTDLSGLSADARFELAGVTLRSLTGWRTAHQNVWTDLDGTPEVWLETRRPESSGQLFEELSGTLALLDDSLALTLGWVYFEAHASRDQVTSVCVPFDCPPGSGTVDNFGHSRQNLRSNGYFGALRWSVSDALRLEAGARWSADAQSLDLALSPVAFQASGTGHFRQLAPSVRMEFAPRDDLTVWVSYGTGYRPGGLDAAPISPTSSQLNRFDAEVRHSTQAGVRGSWLDERLKVGVSGFYDRVHDLQVSQVTSISLLSPGWTETRNAGTTRLAGVELEAWGRPLEPLALRAAAGLLDAKYLDPGGDFPAGSGDLDPVRAPRYYGNLGLTWSFALAKAGRFELDAGWTYVAHYATDPTNADFADVPATSLYDGSFTWRPGQSAWRVTVYGKNLFDREVPGGGFFAGGSLPVRQPLPPRTYGVQIGWSYDDLGDLVQ